jgi:hypothetical protein
MNKQHVQIGPVQQVLPINGNMTHYTANISVTSADGSDFQGVIDETTHAESGAPLEFRVSNGGNFSVSIDGTGQPVSYSLVLQAQKPVGVFVTIELLQNQPPPPPTPPPTPTLLPSSQPSPEKKKSNWWKWAFLAVLVIGAVSAFYYYKVYLPRQSVSQSPVHTSPIKSPLLAVVKSPLVNASPAMSIRDGDGGVGGFAQSPSWEQSSDDGSPLLSYGNRSKLIERLRKINAAKK